MIKLSASRIKTLQSCTFLYWVKYHLKLPDKTNSGALRGTGCHAILEFLKKPRHRKIYNAIIKDNSIAANRAVYKWVKNYCEKVKLNQEDFQMMDEMILVGLNHDYFFEGSEEIIQAEKRFDFEGDGFVLTGFIDTMAKFKKLIKIRDYKTSKQKFTGKELINNIQALMYIYIAKKWYPKLKASVEFLFLRFPKKPSQIVEATDAQLSGIESYFQYLSGFLTNFNEDNAKSDYAYEHQDKKWLCGAGKTWVCPYKKGFEYYSIYDKNGKLNRSVFTLEETVTMSPDETYKKLTYLGCPRHNSSFKSSQNQIDFND